MFPKINSQITNPDQLENSLISKALRLNGFKFNPDEMMLDLIVQAG